MTLRQCLFEWKVDPGFFSNIVRQELLNGRFSGECAPETVLKTGTVQRENLWRYESYLSLQWNSSGLDSVLRYPQIKLGNYYAQEIGFEKIKGNYDAMSIMSLVAFAIWCGVPKHDIDLMIRTNLKKWSLPLFRFYLAQSNHPDAQNLMLYTLKSKRRSTYKNIEPFLKTPAITGLSLHKYDSYLHQYNTRFSVASAILLGDCLIDEHGNRFINLEC